MTRKFIEYVYECILKEATKDIDEAKITSVKVMITECNNSLVIGLKIKWYTLDAFPELAGTWPEKGIMQLNCGPDKPFTMKQLIKISNIWNELRLQSEYE